MLPLYHAAILAQDEQGLKIIQVYYGNSEQDVVEQYCDDCSDENSKLSSATSILVPIHPICSATLVNASPPKERWAPDVKMSAALRVIQGEPIKKVALDVGAPVSELEHWCLRAVNALDAAFDN